MKQRFLLHCNAVLSTFTLRQEGQTWERQFADLKQALDYAATIVKEETPLIVYNELGRVIVESFVSPPPPV